MSIPELKLTCKVIENPEKASLFSLRLPSDYTEKAQDVLRYCHEKRGGFVTFHMTPPKRPRKTGKGSQSAHLNGHIQTIASFTGQPFDDVKKFVKSQAVTRGYPMLRDKDGNQVYDLWGNVQGISEADSTVEECSILIEAAHQLAAELGIALVEE